MVALFTVIVGAGFTEIVKFTGADTHEPLLPLTVYTVVTAGLKFCDEPVSPPGFHV
jgi:hypothetical protein